MKPFTQTADTLDQELADKIDGILAAHGEDPTQLVGILLDVEAAVERHYIPEAAAYYVAERLGVKPTQVYDVISFYTALHDKPRAKFTLEVCSAVRVNGVVYGHLDSEECILDMLQQLN